MQTVANERNKSLIRSLFNSGERRNAAGKAEETSERRKCWLNQRN